MTDVNLLFEQISLEESLIAEFNTKLNALDERIRRMCTIRPTDSRKKIRKKCLVAKKYGLTYAPVWNLAMTQPAPIPTAPASSDAGAEGGIAEQSLKLVTYTAPNVEREWTEAQQYTEFGKNGQEKWKSAIENGEVKKWSELSDVANYQADLEDLNPEKIQRVSAQIKSGKVELPIVGSWDGEEYELIAGNTRIAMLVRLGYDPQVLVIKFPEKKARTRTAPTKEKPSPRPKKKKAPAKTSKPKTRRKQGRKPEPPGASTKRVRKYYKRHPKKVSNYLKKTQDDRVARNRDRRKAVEKYGKKKMKNHDVHHPNGAKNGNWKLARKDHGPDKLDEMYTPPTVMAYEYLLHPENDLHITFGDIKELAMLGLGHGVDVQSESANIPENIKHIPLSDSFLSHMDEVSTKYIEELCNLQKKFGLTDDSTLQEYKAAWWDRMIEFNGVPLTTGDKQLLTDRWGRADKSKRLMGLSTPVAVAWARTVEESIAIHNSKLMHPLHSYIARLTVEAVKRSMEMLRVYNPFLAEKARERFAATIKEIQAENIENGVDKLNRYMQKLEEVGLNNIIPSKGLTFSYNGNLYKYTGPFMQMERLVDEAVPYEEFIEEQPVEPQPSPRIIRKVMTIKEREAAKTLLQNNIINPETKNHIPVKVALTLSREHPAYMAANSLIKRGMMSEGLAPTEEESIELSKVPVALAQPTADYALRAANFGNVASQLVGSIDDDLMNDIDIAIDSEELKTIVGYDGDDMLEMFQKIQEHMEPVQYQTIYSPKFSKITMRVPLMDETETPQPAYDKSETPLDRQGIAKVDFMLGNLNWMSRYLVNGEESNYTPMYRNILIDTIFTSTKFDTENPDVKSKYQISTRHGLYKASFTESEDGPSVIDTAFISDDVDTIAQTMFGPDTSFADIDTFEKLIAMLQNTKSSLQDLAGDIIARYVRKLQNKNVPTPKEVENVEAAPKTIDRTPIAIFPEDFQPYHSGHQHIYSELVKKFGKGNVYIATTDTVESGVAPFTLAQKMDIMTNMFGIPKENIIKAKDMFNPIELIGQFPETTPIVMAVSNKDMTLLNPAYFKPYEKNQLMDGHAKSAYVIEIPEPHMDIDGRAVSSAQLRQIMGNPNITDRAKKEIFTKAYRKFDNAVFDKMAKVSTKAEEELKMTNTYAPQEVPNPRQPAVEKPSQERVSAPEQEPKNRMAPTPEELAGDRELYDEGETWTAPSGRFGAKNSKGKIGYFKTPEAAQQFAMR